jgi:hypothetical protein
MTAQTSGRRWRVLDDGVLAYGLALLRTLWLWPLQALAASSLGPDVTPWLPAWAIFGLLAGGTLAAQLALRIGAQPPADNRGGLRIRGWGVVGAAVSGVFAVAAAAVIAILPRRETLGAALDALPALLAPGASRGAIAALLAAGLWWWGLRSGSEILGYDRLARNFLVGLVALIGVLAANAAAGDMLPRGDLLAQLLLYLGVGLFLLALASIQTTRRFERHGDEGLALPGHWWATAGAVIGGLLLAALLLSLIFAPQTLAQLARGAGALLAVVGQAVAAVLAVVSYPFLLLLAALLSRITFRPFDVQLPQVTPAPNAADPLAGAGTPAALPGDPTAWWILLGVLTVAALIVLFVLALRRLRGSAEAEDVAETHEGILTLDLLKAQLEQLWGQGKRGRPAPAPYTALEGENPAVQVRRIYQQFLAWAAAGGNVRAPGVTPAQYGAMLSVCYPAHAGQFSLIAEAYSAARYGADGVTAADAAAVQTAWQEILAATAVPPPGQP